MAGVRVKAFLDEMEPSDDRSPDTRRRLEEEVRRELARRARSGSVIYAICAVLMALATKLAERHLLLYWAGLAALVVSGAARLAVCSRVRDSARWDTAFTAVSVVAVLIWGVWVGVLVPSEGLNQDALLLLTVSTGLCSGATNAFAPDLRLLRLVQAAMMIPILVGVFACGGWEAVGTGLFCALYASYLVGQGATLHKGYMETLLSRVRLEAQSRQLEEARRAAEEARRAAEEANRVKSQFLANVSHELRTPLNGVVGMTEEVLATTLTNSQREDLGVVKDSAISLLAVINQILDFSRIEAGHLPAPVNERFSLDALLARVVRTFSRDAQKKGLWVFYAIAPDLPTYWVGDPHRLRQVLTNLVGNGLKFTPSGSVVIRAGQSARGLYLEVSDTGIGISSTDIEVLFEPFSQADNSLNRSHQGTGLGLSIVRHLVRSLGGEVEVVSQPDQGTTFRFECESLSPEGEVEQPLRGKSFCLHDEVAERARLLEELLGRWGGLVRKVAVAEGDEIHLVDGDTLPPQIPTARLVQLYRGLSPTSPRPELRLVHSPPDPHKMASCLDSSASTGETGDYARDEQLRILVVEDQPVNAELVRRILERAGHQAAIVHNGSEALDACARELPDLVLMDVQMPIMDGFEATARLRELPGGRLLPIIAVTAHAVAGDVERCLQAGMNAYVSKPIARAELIRVVELHGRRGPEATALF